MDNESLIVNQIMDQDPLEPWKTKLTQLSTAELYDEYNAALAWKAAANETENQLALPEKDTETLKTILETLGEITHERVTSFLTESTDTPTSILTKLRQAEIITDEDRIVAASEPTIEDYFILRYMQTVNQEQEVQSKSVTHTKKPANIAVNLAVALLLAACAPTESNQSTSEARIIQTAEALPTGARQTLSESPNFSEQDINEVKRSTVRIYIPASNNTDVPIECTARLVQNNYDIRFLFLAKHCFIDSANSDLTDIEIETVQIQNPQKDDSAAIEVKVHDLLYIPGVNSSDFMALQISESTDLTPLEVFPMSIDNVIPDFEPSLTDPVLLSGYPSVTFDQKVLQLCDTTATGTMINLEVPINGTVWTFPKVFVFNGDMSSGASGGGADTRVNEDQYFVGVISLATDKRSVVVSPVPVELFQKIRHAN